MHSNPLDINLKLNLFSPNSISTPSLIFPQPHAQYSLEVQEIGTSSKMDFLEPLISTPKKSNPSRLLTPTKSREMCADRFIPVRNDIAERKHMYSATSISTSNSSGKFLSEEELNKLKYQFLLEGQVLGVPKSATKANRSMIGLEENSFSNHSLSTKDTSSRFLQFKTPSKEDNNLNLSASVSPFPLTWHTMDEESNGNLRKIPTKPYKVLDAPQLEDDYYLNLLDWSKSNVLAVALQDAIHLWSGSTGMVKQLCQLPESQNIYTSVSWSTHAECLAAGISDGKLEIWDFNKMKVIRNDLESHSARIGCLAWNDHNILASGSKDKSIILRDMRIKGSGSSILKLRGHKQEICGLKWSYNNFQLASGGNDNKLFIWNARINKPEACFNDHKAAIKALTWSPHQSGLLLSGGGNSDKTIKVWNTHTMKNIRSINTGSQVCNMLFSQNSNELVTTHGFSNNQIIIWDYMNFEKIGVMEGHASRVLYLALSPDGETIVTGAGASDETLRFWHAFPPAPKEEKSSLLPSSISLR